MSGVRTTFAARPRGLCAASLAALHASGTVEGKRQRRIGTGLMAVDFRELVGGRWQGWTAAHPGDGE